MSPSQSQQNRGYRRGNGDTDVSQPRKRLPLAQESIDQQPRPVKQFFVAETAGHVLQESWKKHWNQMKK
tara:strand:- start:941 stop:1147 length:207 start_codon:yes stop_codon:yes gene_type:complete